MCMNSTADTAYLHVLSKMSTYYLAKILISYNIIFINVL